jgi:hypothetical protein
LRTFYVGATATLMRETAGNAAWFTTFRLVSQQFGNDRVLWQNALSGACAGIMYWSVLYPMDVVKTRMQTNPAFGKQIQLDDNFVGTTPKGTVYRPVGIISLISASPIKVA